MKRQPYYPKLRPQQPLWLNNFADALVLHGPALVVPPADVTSHALDARRLAYVIGAWNTFVREIGPAATAVQEEQASGPEGGDLVLPTFTAPAPPAGVVAVSPGALTRIFKLVQVIKGLPGYTPAIGLAMGVVGAEDTTELLVPTFRLVLENGTGCECVRIIFEKGDNDAVYLEGRRGTNPWGFLAIDTGSPYLDDRPLLVAGQPEVREYRMRMYDDAQPTGDWSPVQKITVSP